MGDGGVILRSEDAGEHWTAVDSSVKADLRAAVWGQGPSPIPMAVGAGHIRRMV